MTVNTCHSTPKMISITISRGGVTYSTLITPLFLRVVLIRAGVIEIIFEGKGTLWKNRQCSKAVTLLAKDEIFLKEWFAEKIHLLKVDIALLFLTF